MPHALTVVMVLALVLLPRTSPAHDELDETSASRISTSTNQLITAIGEYQRAAAAHRNAPAAKLRLAARERRNLLLNAIERQPGLALRQSLPTGLTMGLPADVRDLIEQEVELTGRVTGLHGDDMRNKVSTRKYFLELTPEPHSVRYRLHAADLPDHPGHEHPAAPFVGKAVTVRALKIDGQLLLTGEGAIEAADSTGTTSNITTVSGGTVSGTQNTLVLLANFQDKALSCSATQVNNLMFGPSGSVGDLYRETSASAVTFSGSVYGPWQIPYSSGVCSYSTWSSALDNMATAQGINLNNFPRRVYVFPQNVCSSAGYGSSGGTPTRAWIFYCGTTDLYAHELGHNLGFRHAWTPGSEYGDKSDIMGQSGHPLRQLNAANKITAGWIPSARIQNVNGAGVYTIDPTAATNSVIAQALVVPKPDTKDSYFISLRKPLGYDSGLYSTYQNQVSVHRGSTSSGMPTYLLATLGAGESFSDSVNGYRFSVASISTSATVSVEMATPMCARVAPGVSLTPISQSAAAGNSISYQMTITNNNNSGCGTSTFAFTPKLPSGWSSSHSPFTVSLDAGVSTSSTWTVTSPSTGVVEQSYAVFSTTYDTAATTSSATAQGNYIVTTPDSVPPTVKIVSPADGATVKGVITISAQASDNIGIAKVELWVNGKLTNIDTSAPHSFKLNVNKLRGEVTLTARAFDAAGNMTSTSIRLSAVGR